MRTSMMVGVGSLALAGAIAFAQQQGGAGPGQTGQTRVGQPAPQVNLSDLKGAVFVLEFINPMDDEWLELHKKGGILGSDGKLEETHERYKDGVVWLTICPYMDPAAQADAGQVQGIARMHAQQLQERIEGFDLDRPVFLDEGGKLTRSFGITALPYVVIVDKQGAIAYADALRSEGGDYVGLDNFDRAVGEAVKTPYRAGTLPAGAPRDQAPGTGERLDRRDREQLPQRDR